MEIRLGKKINILREGVSSFKKYDKICFIRAHIIGMGFNCCKKKTMKQKVESLQK